MEPILVIGSATDREITLKKHMTKKQADKWFPWAGDASRVAGRDRDTEFVTCHMTGERNYRAFEAAVGRGLRQITWAEALERFGNEVAPALDPKPEGE